METLTATKQLFLHIGKKHYPVESLADASKKFRDLIASQKWGVSDCPKALLRNHLTDQDNNFIGQISYNGKIWIDMRMPPIYNPYENDPNDRHWGDK